MPRGIVLTCCAVLSLTAGCFASHALSSGGPDGGLVDPTDGGTRRDTGVRDTGVRDTGVRDTGVRDTGTGSDSGPTDVSGCDFREYTGASGDHCSGGETRYIALDLIRVAREGPVGVTAGFDLDEAISDDTDPVGCYQPDFTSPEHVPGIDNQLAVLAPTLESAAGTNLDAAFDNGLRSGSFVLVLELRHLGPRDSGNDDCIDVIVHDARTLDTPTPLVRPAGDLVPNQRFALIPGTARRFDGGRTVRQALSTTPSGSFPILITTASADKGALFDMTRAQMSFTLTGDNGAFGGVVGGTLVTDLAVDAFTCAVAGLPMDLVRNTLGSVSDLDPDPAGNCQGMSAVLKFDGVPARVP